MKKISIFLTVFILIFTSFAFADDDDIITEYNEDEETQAMIDEAKQWLNESEQILTGSETTLLTVTPQQSNGFKKVILQLIGNYDTVVTDYTYQNYNGYTQHSIDVQPDYSWIASAVIFLAVLYCALRFIGGLFSGR